MLKVRPRLLILSLGPPESQGRLPLLFIILSTTLKILDRDRVGKEKMRERERGRVRTRPHLPTHINIAQIYQFGLKYLPEATLSSLMPLRITALGSLCLHDSFLNCNVLLLFYFTYQFCMIYLAVPGKCYVTIPQKTLNLIESPLIFWSFIFNIKLSYSITKEAVG